MRFNLRCYLDVSESDATKKEAGANGEGFIVYNFEGEDYARRQATAGASASSGSSRQNASARQTFTLMSFNQSNAFQLIFNFIYVVRENLSFC